MQPIYKGIDRRSAEERRQRDASEEAEPGGGPPGESPAEVTEMLSAPMDRHAIEREDRSNDDHPKGTQSQG
jgi:hypothetical protein